MTKKPYENPWWHKSYPMDWAHGINWKEVGFFGIFIGAFLWIFRPFGLDELRGPLVDLYILSYGVITALVMIFNQSVLPRIFPKWMREENWTLRSEIIWILWNILIISLLNWLYTIYLGGQALRLIHLLVFVGTTVLLGIFPTVIYTLYNQNRLLRQHLAQAEHLQHSIPQTEKPSRLKISLQGANEKKQINIDLDQLLYIGSADNYVAIHYYAEGQVKKDLLRNTLQKIEDQITSFPQLMRCHRAFIVNLSKINSFKGDSQGYKLQLHDLEESIPVSRSYVRDLRSRYQEWLAHNT